MTTHYAAVQIDTRTVYGVGTTEGGARRAARRWAEGDPSSLVVVPCTAAASRHIREHGGAPSASLTVSPTGVCLRGEEDHPRGPRRAGAVLLALTVEEKARARSAADRAHTPLAIWIRSLVLRECDRIDSLDALRCEECGHLTGGGYRGHKRDCSKALVPKPPSPAAA
jgi:hypothetical protein